MSRPRSLQPPDLHAMHRASHPDHQAGYAMAPQVRRAAPAAIRADRWARAPVRTAAGRYAPCPPCNPARRRRPAVRAAHADPVEKRRLRAHYPGDAASRPRPNRPGAGGDRPWRASWLPPQWAEHGIDPIEQRRRWRRGGTRHARGHRCPSNTDRRATQMAGRVVLRSKSAAQQPVQRGQVDRRLHVVAMLGHGCP